MIILVHVIHVSPILVHGHFYLEQIEAFSVIHVIFLCLFDLSAVIKMEAKVGMKSMKEQK